MFDRSMIENMLPAGMASEVAHYTRIGTLCHFIPSGQAGWASAWATPVQFLNDRMELVLGLKTLQDAALKQSGLKQNIPGTIKNLLTSPGRLKTDAFQMSFSGASDELGQWRGYAANGMGCSIVTDAKAVHDVADVAGYVIYDPDAQRLFAENVLSKLPGGPMLRTDITNDPALPAPPVRPTRRLLIPALLLIVGCALIYRVAHDRMANRHDALHGNMEEAQEQLMPVIERLPAGERVPQLLRYADDPSPGLRFAALNLLGDQQDPRVGDALERAYRDSDSEVRKLALLQLWHADLKRGTHLLLCGLHDDDTWLREAAIMEIKALVRGRPRKMDGKVVPNLIAALDDPDDTLPQTATNLLRTLTGHNWYALHRDAPQRRQATIAQWKRWWAGARATWPTTSEYASAGPILPTRADPAPEFALSTLDGRSISLSGQKGRITLLDFWSVGTPASMADAVTLAALDRRYRGQQVDIVGVQMGFPGGSNEAQQIDQLRDWCRTHGIDYTQTLINPGTLEAFGDIHDIPVTVLLDRQGRIRYRWDGGPREPEVFAAAIERLLKE